MNRQPLISEFVNEREMAEILREFVEGMLGTGQRLEAAYQSGDMEEVQRIGHQMKGAGASYGFEEITDAGANLEAAVMHGGDIEACVKSLCELFHRAQLGLPHVGNAGG